MTFNASPGIRLNERRQVVQEIHLAGFHKSGICAIYQSGDEGRRVQRIQEGRIKCLDHAKDNLATSGEFMLCEWGKCSDLWTRFRMQEGATA